MATKGKQTQCPLWKPQFFKILMPGFSHKMTIPPLFYKYIVGEIEKKAVIVSPLGKLWPIEVHKVSNCYYFGEGWQEFSQAHDLDVGYFLLFRYEGEMVFTVTIFDQTTCLKEYNPRQQACTREQPIIGMSKSTDSQNWDVNFSGTSIKGSKFKTDLSSDNPCEKPYLPLPQDFIKYYNEGNATMATLFCPLSKHWDVTVHKDSKGFHFAYGWQKFAVAHNLRRGDSLVLKHKGALNFDAMIFDNNICETKYNLDVEGGVANGIEDPSTCILGSQFTCTMFPSNLFGKVRLNIPRSFLELVDLSSVQRITLMDPSARQWPVNVSHWKVNKKKRVKISSGWKAFCINNNVEVGDKCIFKLVSREKNDVFHVNIMKQKATTSLCMPSH